MCFTSPVSGGWLRTAPSLLLLLSLLTAFSGFGQTTTSFVYNGTNGTGTDGSPQFFTIPTGVTELTVVAFGAEGGGINGGKGGRVDAVLTVAPPQTLTIYVGGRPTTAFGGYNGGGKGIDLTSGGGGATDIRLGGGALSDRILVAGGGGGSGSRDGALTAGYAGGGLIGGGVTVVFLSYPFPTGGSQTAGGDFGGTLGVGGDGGTNDTEPVGGGGGGGGYYGGGADNKDGGAGGSSFTKNPVPATAVTHTQGVRSGNGLLTITYISPGLSLAVNATPNPTCTGTTSATVTATGGTKPYSYTWAAPQGVILSGTSTSVVQATAGAGVSGIQTLTVTVADAATTPLTSTSFVSVTFNTPPANPMLVASGILSCTATSVTLTATPSGQNYAFGSGATRIDQTNQATVSAPGTYSVLITGSNNCTASAQVSVGGSTTAPTGAMLTASPTSILTCAQTALTLTASATGDGLSYAFSGPSGGPTGITARSGMSATVNAPGNYMVVVTGANSCTAFTTVGITSNNTPPTLSVSPASATLTCLRPSVTLTASGNGVSYAWTGGVQSNSLVVVSAGTYSVTARGANGCISTSAIAVQSTATVPTVTLVFNNSATVMGTGIPTITVPATPGQQFQVLGGNSFERVIVIDRVNGYEIRQTDRNTTGVFAINRLGLFSITVTTADGCSRTVQGILVNP